MTRLGIAFPLMCAVVGVAALFDSDAQRSYALFAFLAWCSGAFLRNAEGGLSPRNDQQQPDATNVTPGGFVIPASLAVFPLSDPGSDPIDVVVWLPSLRNFAGILSPEHVIGSLARSRKDGGSLDPENFVEHEAFVQFLHEFLERELPARPGLQEGARRQGEGWVSTSTRACWMLRVQSAANPTPKTSWGNSGFNEA